MCIWQYYTVIGTTLSQAEIRQGLKQVKRYILERMIAFGTGNFVYSEGLSWGMSDPKNERWEQEQINDSRRIHCNIKTS